MSTETVTDEIIEIRSRLAAIDEERAVLPEDAYTQKLDLLDEEHQLHARLGKLRDSLSVGGEETTLELPRVERAPSKPAVP